MFAEPGISPVRHPTTASPLPTSPEQLLISPVVSAAMAALSPTSVSQPLSATSSPFGISSLPATSPSANGQTVESLIEEWHALIGTNLGILKVNLSKEQMPDLTAKFMEKPKDKWLDKIFEMPTRILSDSKSKGEAIKAELETLVKPGNNWDWIELRIECKRDIKTYLDLILTYTNMLETKKQGLSHYNSGALLQSALSFLLESTRIASHLLYTAQSNLDDLKRLTG